MEPTVGLWYVPKYTKEIHLAFSPPPPSPVRLE